MPVQVQLRRGTTSQWSTANPTLASGEVGVDTSLTKFKVGMDLLHGTALAMLH